MDREASTLPSLIGEVLATLVMFQAPSTELLARLVARIREAPEAEIQLGLHALWPFTRHITREEWLRTLSYELEKIPAAPPLRDDAQQWMHQWGIEREAALPWVLENLPQITTSIRDRRQQVQDTEDAAAEGTAYLTPGHNVAAVQEVPAVNEGQSARQDPVDPLARYLPPTDDYYDTSFWYSTDSQDYLYSACSALIAIMTEVRTRVSEDSLFWGVLGRVYEPFAHENPAELEDKIEAAESEVLALRVREGQADLLDYMNYFEEYRGAGDPSLESEYDSLLAAVEEASPAECEALFPKLERLEYDPNRRSPPRPAEESLPIADRLWETILAKPGLSVGLLARAGLFYWLSRDPTRAPTLALVALGRACEGECFEFWRVPPFLPFWAAAHDSANEAAWDLAALCWKRALVDLTLFSGALEAERMVQVDSFPFDARFVREIYAKDTEPSAEPLGRLALSVALEALRRNEIDEWSQLYLVLQEVSRRLGVKGAPGALPSTLGGRLHAQIHEHTRELLEEAESSWASEEQRLYSGQDYAVIGWTYRCAIENEWRERLGQRISLLLGRDGRPLHPKRATLGEMLRAFGRLHESGQIRQRFADSVADNSRLFDELFLRRAQGLVDDYLNEASHRQRYIDRNNCTVMRALLFDDRLLHDLLVCVQPRT
jgi:hypothetical protein